MKSIDLNINSVEVKTSVKSIKSTWTQQLAFDLESFHGVDMNEFERVFIREKRKNDRKKSINKIFQN
jgi:hypothetical protein